jgi:hypothetical protein
MRHELRLPTGRHRFAVAFLHAAGHGEKRLATKDRAGLLLKEGGMNR